MLKINIINIVSISLGGDTTHNILIILVFNFLTSDTKLILYTLRTYLLEKHYQMLLSHLFRH